jgi:hypothetical protein
VPNLPQQATARRSSRWADASRGDRTIGLRRVPSLLEVLSNRREILTHPCEQRGVIAEPPHHLNEQAEEYEWRENAAYDENPLHIREGTEWVRVTPPNSPQQGALHRCAASRRLSDRSR